VSPRAAVAVALGEDAPPLSCSSRNPAEHCSGLQMAIPVIPDCFEANFCNFKLFNVFFCLVLNFYNL